MNFKQTELNRYRQLLFLPTLLVGYFLVASFGVFFSVVLIDIAASFNSTVADVSQLSVIYRFSGLIISIAVGLICLRFKHKVLFLFGSALYGLGALGSAYSSEFWMLQVFQIFFGVGGAITTIMVYTLIGSGLPVEVRGKAVGYAWSSVFIATISVPLITYLIADSAGWRCVLSQFIFPLSILCVIFGYLIIPQKNTEDQNKPMVPRELKKIFRNTSALACVFGAMLIQFCYTLTVYSISFFRLNFSVDLRVGAVWSSIAGIMGLLGSLTGGHLVNPIGRKTLTVLTSLVSGILVISFTYSPFFWLSSTLWVGASLVIGMAFSALYSLVLEQMPHLRGSLMSVNQTFRSAGTVLGLLIGGLVLHLFMNNFQLLMTIYGGANVAMAFLIFIFARDTIQAGAG